MTLHLGYIPASSTIYIPFHTFNSSGGSVTITGLAVGDILIYKNGGTTERSSTAGFTLLDTDGIDFDGKTGLHGFKIDLSDNTDAGFYAAGNHYMVGVSTITADGQTVSFWAATFYIGAAEANVTQFGGTNGTFSGGRPEVNTTHAAGTAWGSGAITAASLAADAITAAKLAADVTTEIQSGLATAASISALNNLSAAQVNAEMLDVLTTDTHAELSAVPAATTTILKMLQWVFMLSRNKTTQTSTTKAIRDDGDTVNVATAAVSDDGTTFARERFI